MWNEREQLQELVLRCANIKYKSIYHQLDADANDRPIRICLDCVGIPLLVEGDFRLGDDGDDGGEGVVVENELMTRRGAIARMIYHWKLALPAHTEILDRGGHSALHQQQWEFAQYPQFYIKLVQKL